MENGKDVKPERIKTGGGVFAAENRGALLIGGLIFSLLAVVAVSIFFYLKSDQTSSVSLNNFARENIVADASAETSEAYKREKRKENERKFKEAQAKSGGVAIPFTFDSEPPTGDDSTDVTNCGCTINDEQLIAAIKRLGLSGEESKSNYIRISKSDIFVSTSGQLMGEDNDPLLYRGQPVLMQPDGQLYGDKGAALLTRQGLTVFLGKQGQLIDQQARPIPLLGDLLTTSGQVYLSTGFLANKAGNMIRQGTSDIYLTSEGQLVTMDARPIRHSGAFVYQDAENKIININSAGIAWENKSVYLNRLGQIVDPSGIKFKTPGVFFSYGGIMIDNDGLLAKSLLNIKKIGDTDIFIANGNKLVDGAGLPITHYGSGVVLSSQDRLLNTEGGIVKNRRKSQVYLSSKGVIRVDVGKGGVQAGVLKTSENVAIDKTGRKITRRGGISRRGQSEIFTTSDGLLADAKGKPILFNKRDTFIDFTEKLENGAEGLITYDDIPVVDSKGRRVYLSLQGFLVDENGKAMKGTGILTTSDNVMMTADGKQIVDNSALEQVLTKDGKPVTFGGKKVFKDKDGRLMDENGVYILSEDGRPVFMDENGNIVDEDGRPIDDVQLVAGERELLAGEIVTKKALLTASGEAVMFNGEAVFTDANGRVVDANGNPILGPDGKEMFMDASGNIVNSDGELIPDGVLKTESGANASKGLKSGLEQLVTKSGKDVTFNGKKVFKANDGSLIDEFGNPILSADGKKMFMDEYGNIVDSDGNVVEDSGMMVSGEKFIGVGDLSLRKGILDSNGNQLQTADGRDVFVDSNGRVVDADGNPVLTIDGREVFMDANGNIVDSNGKLVGESLLVSVDELSVTAIPLLGEDGKAMFVDGKEVFLNADGQLVDQAGNLILGADGKPMKLNEDGEVVDSSGKVVENLIKDAEGNFVNGGFEKGKARSVSIQKIKPMLNASGNPTFIDGKEVFIDSEGRLIDKDGNLILGENGEPLFMDESGNVVDSNGNKIPDGVIKDEFGRDVIGTLSAGDEILISKKGVSSILGADGQTTFVNGKEAFVDAQGRLVDSSGNLILGKDGEPLFLDENGNIVDAKGELAEGLEITDAAGNEIEGALGRGQESQLIKANALLGADGKPVMVDGKEAFVDSEGRLIDADGNLILGADGKPMLLNSSGEVVDSSGKVVMKGLSKGEKKTIIKSRNIKANVLLGADGKPVMIDGKEAFVDREGRLIDADGNLILGADGKPMLLNSSGEVVDSSGKVVMKGLSKGEEKTIIKSRNIKANVLLGADGKPVIIDGKEAFVDSEGRLIDADGNLILGADGKPMLLNSSGEVVDSSGKVVASGLSRGEKKTILKPSEISANVLLGANGKPVMIDGKEAFVDSEGRLIDADGNLILGADGKPMLLNSSGEVVDSSGNVVASGLSKGEKKTIIKSRNIKANVLLGADGKPVMVDGKEAFVDSEGRLIDADGNLILGADGKPMLLNSSGEVVDSSGKVVMKGLSKGEEKTIIKSRNIKANVLLGADGKPVMVDGKEAFVDSEGRLIDADGNLILGADGKPMLLNSSGEVVDSSGKVVMKGLSKGEEKTILKPSDKGSATMKFKGGDVTVAADGSLLDANGNPILSKDGKKVFLDENGNIVDAEGNAVVVEGLSVQTKSFVNKGLGVSNIEQLTTKDGKNVQFQGKNVFKTADGSLIDADGNPILSKDGRKVYMNENGELVDINGNVIYEDLLTADNVAITSGDLKAEGGVSVKKIGNSDVYVSRDGFLLDSKGRAMTFNGKKVKVGKNGQLLDENGIPVLDKNGQPVFMSANGTIIDKNGNPISDSLLVDGDGVLIDSAGMSSKKSIKSIGKSDLFVNADGRLTDKDGKSILYNGESVYVGEDGRMRYADGRPVLDAEGNSVYIDPLTGKMVDKNGNLIKGAVLTNSDGVLVDTDGQLITSGGKLTRIKGTDYFKTVDGTVVDANGRVVKINGETIYVDENGRIVTNYGQPIRFEGEEMFFSEDGRLVNSVGQPVTDSNNRAISLGGGALLNEDGEMAVGDVTGIKVNQKIADNNNKPTTIVNRSLAGELPSEKKKREEAEKQAKAAGIDISEIDSGDSEEITLVGEKPIAGDLVDKTEVRRDAAGEPLLQLGLEDKARIQRRYARIKNGIRERLMMAQGFSSRSVEPMTFDLGGNPDEGNTKEDDAGTEGGSEKSSSEPQGETIARAGQMLYSVTNYQINSDYISDVVVEVVGASYDSPLFGASAFGSFEMAYEKMVIKFNRVCFKDGTCSAMNGVALDPATSEAGVGSEIDHHYWYRYGGLFFSSLLEGASTAVSESVDKEEEIDITGKKTVISGLEGEKLAIRSLGVVGQRFSEAFADNINRPITAWMKPGDEMAILLFEDIYLDK